MKWIRWRVAEIAYHHSKCPKLDVGRRTVVNVYLHWCHNTPLPFVRAGPLSASQACWMDSAAESPDSPDTPILQAVNQPKLPPQSSIKGAAQSGSSPFTLQSSTETDLSNLKIGILRTDRPTDDRPTTNDERPHIWKNSNGHISARGRPIHFMFGCRVGFSGLADRMALFPVWPNSIGMWEKQCARSN